MWHLFLEMFFITVAVCYFVFGMLFSSVTAAIVNSKGAEIKGISLVFHYICTTLFWPFYFL